MRRLEGRTAVLTGAGGQIGGAIAARLQAEGARLVLTGRDGASLFAAADRLKSDGATIIAVPADIRNESDVVALFARARQEAGEIDILVNNAGVRGPTAPVAEQPARDFEEVLRVNVAGTFLCSREVLKSMVPRRRGVIINIASVAGKIGYALRSPYAASKWAVLGFTETMALEVGPYGIRVNAICPGPVEGPIIRSVIENRARATGRTPDEIEAEYLASMPLGRMARGEDVASMVAYLASDEGASITGQAISVDSGYVVS
jgi:NAD(P)-dependent dehydrogenase (short-subunit alcohol dehydrogenase family)